MIVRKAINATWLAIPLLFLSACGNSGGASVGAAPQSFTVYSTVYVPFLRYTTVRVPVSNHAPIAEAGANQSVNVWNRVTLDGSGSRDLDHDFLGYSWIFDSKPSGSNVNFDNATFQHPTFTPDLTGDYSIRLTVTDGKTSSVTSAVLITALPYVGSSNTTDSTGTVSVVTSSYDYSYQTSTSAMVIIRMNVVTNDGLNHSFDAYYSALDIDGNIVYSSNLTGGAPNIFQTSASISLADYSKIHTWAITKVERYI